MKFFLEAFRKRFLLLLLCLFGVVVVGKSQQTFTLEGVIYEESPKNGLSVVPGAQIAISQYGLGGTSDFEGRYKLSGIPQGKVQVTVSFIGKVPIDTVIYFSKNQQINFTLQEENFRLEQVVVTAERGQAGQATTSKISSSAMEHLQAMSLSDLMALLPGGFSSNPTLNSAKQINIRNIGGGANMNALGTAIVQDGTPISNNANLQTMHPSVAGSVGSLGGGASPSGGIDTRSIALENVEYIEVIRGIPSAEYGDLTSGAVLITSKAGGTPLVLKARTNPNAYQFSAKKGVNLGQNSGALNISADYAHSSATPTASYKFYDRLSGQLLYSNSFFNRKWKSNTSMDVVYGRDIRELNPDDEVDQISSNGKDLRLSLNTNGTIFVNRGWLKNIKYIVSGSYSDKYSYYHSLFNAANAPYSMTTVDGAVITNTPGQEIYDTDGNQVTNWSGVDPAHFATYLPSTYGSEYRIYGKELGLFSKLSTTLFGRLGSTDHRILIGLDYKMDGNVGAGKVFDAQFPPYRNLSALNATYRPRAYKEIPFINHFGLFVEENFSTSLFGKAPLKIQAGMRYDIMSKVSNTLSPRINGSIEVIPNWLTLRGGYGIAAKMPTLLYLYPEKAYFEYININEMASEREDKLFITTTRIFDTENRDLKVATNHKTEVGLDLKTPIGSFSVTAFDENLQNGYSMSPVYQPLTYKEYVRTKSTGNQPLLKLDSENPVLASYYIPSNDLRSLNRGIEWDFRFNRIEAIRTTFSWSGSWQRGLSYNSSYTHFDRSGTGASDRTHVGLYGPALFKHYFETMTSALRVTHNVPDLGLVVTLVSEAIWSNKDYYEIGNDTIPVAYISKVDGKQYPFDESKMEEPEFSSILMPRVDSYYITESYPPLFNFNLNITKEISNFMRISFFANNMFRSYPKAESKRNPGSFFVRNKQFFFGFEVTFTL